MNHSNVEIGLQEQAINTDRHRRVRSLFSRVSSLDSLFSSATDDDDLKSYDPDEFGHITMSVRESCKDSFDSVRVPYARFDRGRLSKSLCSSLAFLLV